MTSGGLAAVSSSFFAALYSAFGRYDVVHIHAEGPAFFAWLPKMFGKRVVVTVHGIDWQREKWQSGLGSKFIHQGEKNAAKYADEVIVLSKGVQDYFKETYGRKTHFIPNGVNRPQIREAKLITDNFGLEKDSYILFLGRLVPEKGIRYLVEAFKNVKTDKKLVIAGGSSDTDTFMAELRKLAKGDDRMDRKYKVGGYVKLAKLWERSKDAAVAYHSSYHAEKFRDDADKRLVGVYIDITGNKEIYKRPEMVHLLKDCKNGSVNLIFSQTRAYLAANTCDFCFLLKYLFDLPMRVDIVTDDDDQRIDTILDVDNQRQSLKDLAEKYTSIRRKDYLEWRIRLEHEMTKVEEK